MTFTQGGGAHFIGIGGVGMSAIAKVLLERGIRISGSDLKRSRSATMLEAMGATVAIGHDPSNIAEPYPDVVVVSSAVPSSNPELGRAQELGIDVLSRGEALAALLQGARSVVVAGTHGKTTTTSMIVTALRSAGIDPTYLVGGGLNDAGTNARHGRDAWSVAESDESDGSFLLLTPTIAVVTNVEADHLDYWGSEAAVFEAFGRFLSSVEESGAIIVPSIDARVKQEAEATGRRVVTFGAGGVVGAEGIEVEPDGTRFSLVTPTKRAVVKLRVPGAHNVDNALAAAAACLEMGVDIDDIARGLGGFSGVDRRFQVRGQALGVTVIDDYAHHPTEIRATLAAARPGPWRRVIAVFQPHRYSRTNAFAREFGAAFDTADRIVVTDVYGAGEPPVPGITGKLVADSVCNHLPGRPVAYLPHRGELLAYLQGTVRPGDAVLTLGAGDITSVGEELLERMEAS